LTTTQFRLTEPTSMPTQYFFEFDFSIFSPGYKKFG
jgi:hypothetical protein